MLGIVTGWFDWPAWALIIVGAELGRRRGASTVLLGFIQWVAIVFLCGALYYRPARYLTGLLHCNPNFASALVYLVFAALLAVGFHYLQHSLGKQLLKKDLFGRGEFTVGAVLGGLTQMLRLVVVMAVASAIYVDAAAVEAQRKYQREYYGQTITPSVGSLQLDLTQHSWVGSRLTWYFRGKMIYAFPTGTSTPPPEPPPIENTPKQRNSDTVANVDEVMDGMQKKK